jgi:hypothetical protein
MSACLAFLSLHSGIGFTIPPLSKPIDCEDCHLLNRGGQGSEHGKKNQVNL